MAATGKPNKYRQVEGKDGQIIKRGVGRPRNADLMPTVDLDHIDELDVIRANEKKKKVTSQFTTSLPATMRVMALPPIDDNDPEQVSIRIGEYLQICCEENIPVTTEGLALAFHINQRSLHYWLSGAMKGKPTEVVELLQAAVNLKDTVMAQDGLMRGDNPAFRIFLMRNGRTGYTNDDSKLDADSYEFDAQKRSAEEIVRKYQDLVDDD